MPTETQGVLAAVARAAAVMFGAATVLSVGALVAHLHEFGSIAGDYNGGPGMFAMGALSVLMVPNAICFGVAYIERSRLRHRHWDLGHLYQRASRRGARVPAACRRAE